MKDIVTFETAKRLKEAGFPQPEQRIWQVWYNAFGHGCLIVWAEHSTKRFAVFNMAENVRIDLPSFDLYTFAPTATDILEQEEMSNCSLYRHFSKWCVKNQFHFMEFDLYENDNPAEAAAAAWLQIHEKKDLEK
jgi:hypothetical protein